ASEKYTINCKLKPKGDEIEIKQEGNDEFRFAVMNSEGKIVNQNVTKLSTIYAYRETVLEKSETAKKVATRLRRQYTRATVKSGEKVEVLRYQGKSVLI